MINEKIAFVFPGQGSQKSKMLSDYYSKYPIVKETFDEANSTLGYNLWQLIQNDEVKINQTEYTQPAILVSSIAIYKVLKEISNNSIKANYYAGHSLGEYTALTVANAIDFKDAVKLVQIRGQLMQEAVTDKVCAMSAILGLSDEDVIAICKESSKKGVVEPANFNTKGQIVISGEKQAVEFANTLAKSKGAKRAQLLPVSVPSHCSLMKDAALKFSEEVNSIQIKNTEIKIIQNVDALSHENIDDIRKNLIDQLYMPVLWSKTVENLAEKNIDTIIECGPSKVLSGLNKRIHPLAKHLNTSSVEELMKLIELQKDNYATK